MTIAYQSVSLVVMFKAYLASDHVTEATGKTIAITISKNGGAFGNPNAGATNATEVSSGWYKFTLDTTDTNTIGPLAYRGAVATIDDVGGTFYVIATLATPTNITAATGVDITKILGTAISTPATAGILDVNVKNIDNDAASASGTVTFPNATLASTTNITGGTITTVTNLTNAPTAGDFTATMKTSITTAVPTAAAITTAVLAGAVDGTTTLAQSQALQNSALAGKLSGAGSGTETARDLADTKDRLVYTVDASGNRTAVTRTLT